MPEMSARYYNAGSSDPTSRHCCLILFLWSTAMETNERSSKDAPLDHTCSFSLQETSPGYLSGAYVCKQCGYTTTREQFLQNHTPSPD